MKSLRTYNIIQFTNASFGIFFCDHLAYAVMEALQCIKAKIKETCNFEDFLWPNTADSEVYGQHYSVLQGNTCQ